VRAGGHSLSHVAGCEQGVRVRRRHASSPAQATSCRSCSPPVKRQTVMRMRHHAGIPRVRGR